MVFTTRYHMVDVEGWQKIDGCLIKVEAHWVASAQAIHALADTLAHFIYFALGLNLPRPWREQDISFKNLIVELKKPDRFPESYGAVLSELEKLLGAEEFKTIDAFVNHNKHRGIPEPVLAVEPDENRLYAVKHGDFIYRSSPYPSKEIEALLAPAYKAVSRAVVDTGNSVNAALSGQVGMDA